jgi:hypothetical protein
MTPNDEEPNKPGQRPKETDQDTEGIDSEHPCAQGVNDLLAAIANVIEEERIVHAVSSWVDSHAGSVKRKDFSQ